MQLSILLDISFVFSDATVKRTNVKRMNLKSMYDDLRHCYYTFKYSIVLYICV